MARVQSTIQQRSAPWSLRFILRPPWNPSTRPPGLVSKWRIWRRRSNRFAQPARRLSASPRNAMGRPEPCARSRWTSGGALSAGIEASSRIPSTISTAVASFAGTGVFKRRCPWPPPAIPQSRRPQDPKTSKVADVNNAWQPMAVQSTFSSVTVRVGGVA